MLEKLTSCYKHVYEGSVVEDALFEKCRNATEKLEKEIGIDNMEHVNGTGDVEELQRQHGILSECIQQLKEAKSLRSSLLSQLRETIHEQELKIVEVRRKLQSRYDQVGNILQQLLSNKIYEQVLPLASEGIIGQSVREDYPSQNKRPKLGSGGAGHFSYIPSQFQAQPKPQQTPFHQPIFNHPSSYTFHPSFYHPFYIPPEFQAQTQLQQTPFHQPFFYHPSSHIFQPSFYHPFYIPPEFQAQTQLPSFHQLSYIPAQLLVQRQSPSFDEPYIPYSPSSSNNISQSPSFDEPYIPYSPSSSDNISQSPSFDEPYIPYFAKQQRQYQSVAVF